MSQPEERLIASHLQMSKISQVPSFRVFLIMTVEFEIASFVDGMGGHDWNLEVDTLEKAFNNMSANHVADTASKRTHN